MQPLWPDEALYAHTARNFYRDQSLSFDGTPWRFQPPLFIFFLSFLYFIIGESEFAARISGPLLGTLTVLGVYLLGKHLYDNETGLLSSLFIAAIPVHVFFTRMILADNLLTASLVFALFFFSKYINENQRKYLYLSGIFIAAVALSKKIGILIYPVLVLYLLLREKNFSWMKRRDLQLMFLVSILIQFPWYVRNYLIFSNPLISPSLYPIGFVYEFGKTSLLNVLSSLFYTVSPPIFLLALLGILFLLKDKKEILFPGMPAAAFLPAVFITRLEPGRYLLPVLPFFSIFAGYGVRKFSEKRAYYPLFVSFLLFTVLFGVDFSIKVMEYNKEKYAGYKETGEWLKEHASENAAVMTNSRALRYYSERDSAYFPEKEDDFWRALKDYGRRYNEVYVAIEDWPTDPPTPSYIKDAEKGLKNPVFSFKNIIRVYKNE